MTLPHRVADFRVRLSNQATAVEKAITAFAKGNALPLIQAFPTSLLFGFWNSRGEDDFGVKHARILLSRIDAHDVAPCRRHSQYTGPYSEDEFREVVLDNSNKHEKLSKHGFTGAPSDGLGGVLVNGKIERISVLSLSDIARINCFEDVKKDASAEGSDAQQKKDANHKVDEVKTNAARRYLFALAVLAEGHERSKGSHRLRSGCELVAPNVESKPTIEFRGAQPQSVDELMKLYNDRTRLIEIAKKSMEILGIKTVGEKYEVSKETLRGQVVSDDEEAKRLKKEAANAKKEADKAEAAAKRAEEKAEKPDAKDKDKKDAEEKRRKADELSAKAEELSAKLTETTAGETGNDNSQPSPEATAQ